MKKIIFSAFILFVPMLIGATEKGFPGADNDVKAARYFPQWLANAPYAPVFKVRGTEHKYGRYASQTKTVTLKDLIKFHGHFCGGLVEGAGALRVAFDTLFTDGIIDRTDLRVITKNSACGVDVATYLTGARVRYGSCYLDSSLKASEYIIQQVSTGKTVHVKVRKEGIPTEVRKQMREIESGSFTPQDIDLFRELQWDYAKRLVNRPLSEAYTVDELQRYALPEPPCRDWGKRTDNNYKNVPLHEGTGQ